MGFYVFGSLSHYLHHSCPIVGTQYCSGIDFLVLKQDSTDALGFNHFLFEYWAPKWADCSAASLITGAVDLLHSTPDRFSAPYIQSGGVTLLTAKFEAVISNCVLVKIARPSGITSLNFTKRLLCASTLPSTKFHNFDSSVVCAEVSTIFLDCFVIIYS